MYEFPLNERMRLFIRVEQLFAQLDHFMTGRSVWDSRVVVATLVDIVGVFSRNDLKAESLLEIERQSSVLHKMARLGAGIDQSKLELILARLDSYGKQLYANPGKVGSVLMEDELFKSISQRSSIPGGTCSFDSPAYHHWLQGEEFMRRADLTRWIEPFQQIRAAIDMLLNFIRTCAAPTAEIAPAGFFQKSLDYSLAFQLLRVGVARPVPYYAEISGGKHRFTIRFMLRDNIQRASQATDDVSFQLTCCLF
jgi:cell division protein ZapD